MTKRIHPADKAQRAALAHTLLKDAANHLRDRHGYGSKGSNSPVDDAQDMLMQRASDFRNAERDALDELFGSL